LNAALVKLESVEGGTCHAAGIDTLHELGNRAVRLEKFSPTSARSNRLAIENLYCLSAMRWCGSERERRHGIAGSLNFTRTFRKLCQRGFRGDADLPV
jgi:predicted ABC-class ATPase